ncbi:hypothetical protein D3C81_2031600 [compost metagenome]
MSIEHALSCGGTSPHVHGVVAGSHVDCGVAQRRVRDIEGVIAGPKVDGRPPCRAQHRLLVKVDGVVAGAHAYGCRRGGSDRMQCGAV